MTNQENLSKGLCVNAGAGSGKTTMLVRRYLEILSQSKSDPARIVAITFTEKAAAEMKSRIRSEMQAKYLDPVATPAWKARLNSMANARISTIHGFCTHVLRQYAIECHLDPSFGVLDAVQADLLLKKTIAEHWRKLVETKHALLLRCMDFFQPERLIKIIEQVVLQRAYLLAHAERFKQISKNMLLEALREAQAADAGKEFKNASWSRTDDEALECMQLLLKLAQEFDAEFQRVKTRLRRLDFDDLQIRTLELLSSERMLEKIRQDIDYLLVDEFQDSDEIQRQIFTRLAPMESLFAVGDPKQSIYRFRGADVSVFRRLQQDMPSHGSVITLDLNYRSLPGILNFCNDFFAGLMENSSRPYEIPHQALQAHRQQANEPACVHAWMHKLGQDEKVPVDELRKREAAHIAETLQRWKSGHAPFENFRLSDVAILFRSMGKVYLYERELEKLGIPFTTSSTSAFFGQQCITDMLNAMTVAANRIDDVAMAGFLRSPMVGLSDEDLLRLRGENSLWDSLSAHDTGTLDTAQMVQAKEWIARWHVTAGLGNAAELLKQILSDTGFEILLLAQHLGRRKVALLGKMLELAEGFRPEESQGIVDFLEYMKELLLEEKGEYEGPLLEQDEAVSLLTVHKAKGLEFKVVIVADMGRWKKSSAPEVLLGEEFGLGVKLRDAKDEVIKPIPRLLGELEERRKESAEEKRLLYVACTRAKDMLIFSGINSLRARTHAWNGWMLDYMQMPSGKRCLPEISDINPIDVSKPHAGKSHRNAALACKQSPESPDEKTWALIFSKPEAFQTPAEKFTVSQVDKDTSTSIAPAPAAGRNLQAPLILSASEEPPRLASSANALSASQLGSLVHAVLARWDRKNDKDLPQIIESLLQETLLTPTALAQTQQHAWGLIDKFLSSSAADALRKAKVLHKEIPFVLPLPSLPQSRLEGTIDVLYQKENGTWAVLDYKTDKIPQQQVAQRAKEYERQIQLYAAAAMQILNIPSIRLELFFLTPETLWETDCTATQAARFLVEVSAKIKSPFAATPS